MIAPHVCLASSRSTVESAWFPSSRRPGRRRVALGATLAMALLANLAHAYRAPAYTKHTFELGPLGYRVGVIRTVDQSARASMSP